MRPNENCYGRPRVFRHVARIVLFSVGGLIGAGGTASVRADELLVSGFGSDAVSRYDAATGAHLGNMTAGGVNGPQAVRLGPDGFLYIANEENDNVLRYDAANKTFLTEFVSSGDGGLDGPTALDFGPDGNLYVASFNTDAVLKYDGQTGAYIEDFVPSGVGGLNGPDVGMIFGPDGNLYVPSFFNHRVIRYNSFTGAPTTLITQFTPGALVEPRTILFHTDGLMYVASDAGDKVNRYTMTGTYVSTYVAAGADGLDGASGMAFDANGVLYVSSWRNDRVLRRHQRHSPRRVLPAGNGRPRRADLPDVRGRPGHSRGVNLERAGAGSRRALGGYHHLSASRSALRA